MAEPFPSEHVPRSERVHVTLSDPLGTTRRTGGNGANVPTPDGSGVPRETVSSVRRTPGCSPDVRGCPRRRERISRRLMTITRARVPDRFNSASRDGMATRYRYKIIVIGYRCRVVFAPEILSRTVAYYGRSPHRQWNRFRSVIAGDHGSRTKKRARTRPMEPGERRVTGARMMRFVFIFLRIVRLRAAHAVVRACERDTLRGTPGQLYSITTASPIMIVTNHDRDRRLGRCRCFSYYHRTR